jgi:hypothetical protein
LGAFRGAPRALEDEVPPPGEDDADEPVARLVKAIVDRNPPGTVINLPFWSTLMLDLDACRGNAGHDQRIRIPPLTTTEADGDVGLITRLPASGL